jgi:hypothetical protein
MSRGVKFVDARPEGGGVDRNPLKKFTFFFGACELDGRKAEKQVCIESTGVYSTVQVDIIEI